MKTPDARLNVDIAIIGGGAAGLSVAAGAARLGRSVVLFEAGAMGGECLNTGCVPSKALIAAASRAAAVRSASAFGVSASEPEIDFPAVMAHVNGAIATIEPHDSVERFEGLGVTVIQEPAAFVGPDTVASASTQVRARRIVVATGSRPAVPPIPGLDAVGALTNETVWSLTERPSHLLVLGGGAMGVELSQAFARLGAAVTLIEQADTLAPGAPAGVGEAIEAALVRDGVTVRTSARVEAAAMSQTGPTLSLAGGERVSGSHVLVAAGRRPSINGLALEAAGVDADRDGIVVDRRLRTSNPKVYALGDVVSGGPRLTHAAGAHASVFVRGVLFRARADADALVVPRAIYTQPEAAWVGMDTGEAVAAHGADAVRTGEWGFADNDRAIADGDRTGFARIVARTNGVILGATVVGAGAGDLIHTVSLAMASGVKMSKFASAIAAYPTRAEALKRAAGAWYEPVVFGAGARRLVGALARLP